MENDPEWTEAEAARYCYDLGYNVEQRRKWSSQIHKEDEEYPAGGGQEYGSHCS
jgi:hypothetical protein